VRSWGFEHHCPFEHHARLRLDHDHLRPTEFFVRDAEYRASWRHRRRKLGLRRTMLPLARLFFRCEPVHAATSASNIAISSAFIFIRAHQTNISDPICNRYRDAVFHEHSPPLFIPWRGFTERRSPDLVGRPINEQSWVETMFNDQLLAGRRILVTGGGTGLGKSMATRFLELGAEVHICGRRKSVCDETATELMDLHGGRVVSHGVDIRNALAVDEMIEQIWTDGPLTDLINNAAGNFISRTEELSPRGFDAVANIVMHGTFYVTHAVGRRWIAQRQRGNVVSITVTWVRNGSPYVVPSAMSKSAIHAMTMSLAAEWGHYGIRLNTIAPGEIPTEGMSKRIKPGDEAGARTKAMNPMGRVGKMEELQNLAVFLISGGCDWINGETIAMDGGQALAMGGNFYQLRKWSDADWNQAREAIKAQNEKDRAARG
jgi:NAD(P)-dependent dehydrogenase (short-subunit alcohol dehydrogenase family)